MRLVSSLLLAACTSEGAPRQGDRPPGDPADPASCANESALEAAYVPQEARTAGVLPACAAVTHPIAGATGSIVAVVLDGDGPFDVSAVDPGGRVLVEARTVDAGETVEVAPQVSGEVLFTVGGAPRDRAYTLEVACAAGCDRRYTRFPILLMHGLGGAESFDGVDYFVGVEDALGGQGVVVAAPAVAPFDDSLARALEWEGHLDALLARGHRRANLVGHSMGGTDARLLASDVGLGRGDAIASVTTIGTPHRGSPACDLLMEGVVDGVLAPWALDLGAELFAAVLGLDVDDPAFVEAVAQMSTPVATALDAALLDHEGTSYASWAGRTCGILEPDCIEAQNGELVGFWLAGSYLLLWPEPNDGLVPVESQAHGERLGDLPADHANEVGQLEDQDPDPFDHVRFFREEAARLLAAGW